MPHEDEAAERRENERTYERRNFEFTSPFANRSERDVLFFIPARAVLPRFSTLLLPCAVKLSDIGTRFAHPACVPPCDLHSRKYFNTKEEARRREPVAAGRYYIWRFVATRVTRDRRLEKNMKSVRKYKVPNRKL